jgi:hypothetical protein
VQGVRGGGHLPAPAPEERLQGVRGGGHLSAPQTTGEAAEDDEAGAFEAGALALALMHGLPQKRQKTVLTLSISLVPGDTGGAAAESGEFRAIAAAVTKSQLCSAAATAPLLEDVRG